MKLSTAWAGIYFLVGAALLGWVSSASAQMASSSSVGGGSRIGATGGAGGAGGTSAGGYSLSGGTSGAGLGTGASSMGAGTTGAPGLGGFGATPGAGATAGGATGVPSSSNLFGSYYVNPMSVGRPGTTTGATTSGTAVVAGSARFGTPLYTTSTTGTSTVPGITGTLSSTPGAGGLGGLGTTGTTGRRGPAYTTVVTFPYDLPKPAQLQTDLQQILSTSPALTSKDVKVKVDGQVLVLEGSVSNDRERRLAEGLVRLTPGVRRVRNNLVIKLNLSSKQGS